MKTKKHKIHSTKLYQIHELDILLTLVELNPWQYITPESPEVNFDELVSVLAARKGLTLYPSYVKRLVDKRIRGYYRYCRDPTKLDAYCEKVAPQFKGLLMELIEISEMGGRRTSHLQLPSHSNTAYDARFNKTSQTTSSPQTSHLEDRNRYRVWDNRMISNHHSMSSGLHLYDMGMVPEQSTASTPFPSEPMAYRSSAPSATHIPPLDPSPKRLFPTLPPLSEITKDLGLSALSRGNTMEGLTARYEEDINRLSQRKYDLSQERFSFHENLIQQRNNELNTDRRVMARFFEKWDREHLSN